MDFKFSVHCHYDKYVLFFSVLLIALWNEVHKCIACREMAYEKAAFLCTALFVCVLE